MKRHLHNSLCPFCNPEGDRVLLLETQTCFALYDKFPVSKGHSLIIPRRHCGDYFQLSFSEQTDCWNLLNQVKEILQDKFNPDGFNIGINISEAAGQTIPHVHIHIIPRYTGDVKEPRGGVRGVIPEKRNY
jgi:diadenosine tetraphosphate (Ap4A) HIT family hydrolase